ncbi:adenylate/guanylate cyclase domain-containing protein [Mesorhizobium sp. CN2-181]|uniref:adenylate/guanylate cyclase domain-containing protein n=1 Tax=Mesorhizobium yinganensis TaxID=3157707 RepID=UPI0032B75CEC
MDKRDVDEIAAWLAARGLEGGEEVSLLHDFCRRCQAAGLALGRAIVIIDTLHPIYEGRGFRWREDDPDEPPLLEFRRNDDTSRLGDWYTSPFYHLLQKGGGELRCRLHAGDTAGFSAVEELRVAGQTDYFATVHMFAPDAVLGEMDNLGSRWTTARPGGFTDSEIEALRYLTPLLGLAIKASSLVRVSQALVEAYLGRDPGQRVLKGRISRGQVDKINAVLWFSDLKSFTTHSEAMESGQIIPFLNDHADVVISAIHAAGGDVLKLIGDGILAIFGGREPADAATAALRAEADMRLRLTELHERRMAEGVPVADVYLGLHIGDVFYGNIGSAERLDFTVVGRAVNEVSRIASMCGSVDRRVLFSTDFHATLPEQERAKLVSVGRYALRGVGRAQELFTLDPELVAG